MTHAASLGAYQTVTLPQGKIRYREAGSGPPIVFVHGLLVNGDLWRRVVPHLSESFRCIVPDLPLGSHQSSMPESADLSLPGLAGIVHELIVSLDIDEVTLVGADTGGAISQMVIARHSERIARLALTNCDAYRRFPPPILLPFKWAAFCPGFMTGFAAMMRFIPSTGRLLYATLAHHDPGKTVLFRLLLPIGGKSRRPARCHEGASGRHPRTDPRRRPRLFLVHETGPNRLGRRRSHLLETRRPAARTRLPQCPSRTGGGVTRLRIGGSTGDPRRAALILHD